MLLVFKTKAYVGRAKVTHVYIVLHYHNFRLSFFLVGLLHDSQIMYIDVRIFLAWKS